VSATSSQGSGRCGSLELELERNVHAPSIARSAISERLLALGIDGSFGQTVVLLVSEVVSNAVRHSTGPVTQPITLAASVTTRTVRVAVTDGGEGFTPRPRDPERIGDGYGLYLLEKAAAAWGVEHAHGTTVWFELARP
jgi:anti-sigma regulatory factor (Ser/Thr protein kinase)